jgi:hypothetical protein
MGTLRLLCLVSFATLWQCVEFARRWWIQRADVLLPNVMWAAHIFESIHHVRALDESGYLVPLGKYADGVSTEAPAVGDLLIWKVSPAQARPVGQIEGRNSHQA